MVQATADMAAALAGLNRSAVKAYGEEAASRFTSDSSSRFAETLARIEAARVTIEADDATVRYPTGEAAYTLHRDAGRWLIPMAELSKGASADALEQRLTELNLQVGIVRELTTEITASKHAGADAAIEAWRGKIMHALSTHPTTTTAPASRRS